MQLVLWRLPLRVGIGFAVVSENGIGHSGRRRYSGCVGKRAACRRADRYSAGGTLELCQWLFVLTLITFEFGPEPLPL